MTSAGTRLSAGRAFFAATAVVGAAALVTQLVLTLRGIDVLGAGTGVIAPAPVRVLRFFSYFTIQSNLLVIATCASLALRPDRDGRGWRVARLDARSGISVTVVVYLVALAPYLDLRGLTWVTDQVFHIVVPILAVGGWWLFGPRPRVDDATVPRALI